MSVREKTVNGLIWSFIDNFSGQVITFVIGIILARLLKPSEFGLVGMVTIFIAVSETFISSGFGQALIRKKDCTEKDFSTVFFFNITAGFLFFLVLFFSAPLISSFFNEPKLFLIIRVMAMVLIIDSFTIVQRTTLTKRIDFKLQTRISIIANLSAGIASIILAFKGFGVWSLVYKTIIQRFITSLFLWLWNKWRPVMTFSKDSFRSLFSFGSKLLISGLIDTLYRNIYYFIIGKYFSADQLGYYTRADRFNALPSENLNAVVSKVSYPVLSEIKEDAIKLKSGYKRLISSTMLLSFVIMIGMASIADSMILALIGEKWERSIFYLRLLCFVGMLYPLHSLNLNMLLVKGRSDLGLRLEIIKKILAVPVIFIGIAWGIETMILGMIVNSLLAYYLNSYWSGRLIGYSIKEQVSDILPSFFISAFVWTLVFVLGLFLKTSPAFTLIIQVSIGFFLVILLCELFKLKEYFYIKSLVMGKYYKFRSRDAIKGVPY